MNKILILGGTQFIGRNLVEQLLKIKEFDLTLFNRQKTKADLFPQINKIKGDRETNDIRQIANTAWDYVIDVSCYYPDSLVGVLQQLQKKPKKYILISTTSVYDIEGCHIPLKNEKAGTLLCHENERTDRTNASYGNRKAECERILIASGMNYVILRPSLVYGAHDHTDRLYYWLYQVKHQPTILYPDNGDRLFSLTYVNDLVFTIINSLESNKKSVILNIATVVQASIKLIVNTAQKQLNKNNQKVNATPTFLKENDISQWTDMPLWIDGDHYTYSNENIISERNFKPTDFAESIKDTIKYYNDIGWKEPIYGMSEEKRLEIIAKIKQGDQVK